MEINAKKLDVVMEEIYRSIYNVGIYNGETNINVTVEPRDSELYVSFRPTLGQLGSVNWDTNLDFLFGRFKLRWQDKNEKECLKTYQKNVFVHRGFTKAFDSIKDELRAKIDKEQAIQSRKVVFVGHSLGGALASIAYIYFDYLYSEVYTTGAPRYMGFISASRVPQSVKDNIYRIVNDRDGITSLPPFIFGFKHIGWKVRIGKWWRFWTSFTSWESNSHTQHAYRRSIDKLLDKA